MAQFDLYMNPNSETNPFIPYLLDVQSDLLDVLNTRIVVPLHSQESISRPIRHLNPVLEIEGERFVLSTAELAAIRTSSLGDPVGNILKHRDTVMAALDFAFTGI